MRAEEESPDSNLSDPWTPDQETALLKALVHYKPVGLHAHFRMLSIRNHLLQSGTTDAETPHTRIPGIWTKIKSLYDIEQLGEREDEVFTSLDDDDDSDADDQNSGETSRRGKRAKKDVEEATTKKPSYWRDFELPAGWDDGGFEALMWERRLNPDGTPDNSDSETRSPSHTKNGGGDDTTDEPHSSPVGRGTRSGRKGRVNRLRDEMEVDSPSSTRTSRSKAASEAEGNEDDDHPMEDAEDEDEEEGEDEEEDESEDHNEGDEERKSGGSKRGRGGNRGRGKRGRRKK